MTPPPTRDLTQRMTMWTFPLALWVRMRLWRLSNWSARHLDKARALGFAVLEDVGSVPLLSAPVMRRGISADARLDTAVLERQGRFAVGWTVVSAMTMYRWRREIVSVDTVVLTADEAMRLGGALDAAGAAPGPAGADLRLSWASRMSLRMVAGLVLLMVLFAWRSGHPGRSSGSFMVPADLLLLAALWALAGLLFSRMATLAWQWGYVRQRPPARIACSLYGEGRAAIRIGSLADSSTGAAAVLLLSGTDGSGTWMGHVLDLVLELTAHETRAAAQDLRAAAELLRQRCPSP